MAALEMHTEPINDRGLYASHHIFMHKGLGLRLC